eukprot:CAMPEP_0119486872 /NCGR_PEP_ID=MMETSP1344-20130328/13134_1 /TAXON_ID=236787 /ORGANISM="Florenciella parvula, Strain CCMP2471" /LENGTH=66 /DNA_ID=CAMNT_0007521675 /DNA_START=267 /DNA_END=463 /DNA_ORIENTATION=-
MRNSCPPRLFKPFTRLVAAGVATHTKSHQAGYNKRGAGHWRNRLVRPFNQGPAASSLLAAFRPRAG